MKSGGILTLLIVTAFLSGPAFSAPRVANTSQKGSLLIFPLIDVRPGDARTTIVEISNDNNKEVFLNCNYIDQQKGRVDFHFGLSPKATVSWDVLTGNGDIFAPPFPNSGPYHFTVSGVTYPDPNVGELVCFAVDVAGSMQVRFNHLSGHATVVAFNDANTRQPRQAFRYNAWAFAAEGTASDNSPVGTPGDLQLTGTGIVGVYDACPQYLIESYMPGGTLNGMPNTLGRVTSIDNDISLSTCRQDLREGFSLHLTKLRFEVWNAFEEEFTGAYHCADSVETFGLDDPKDEVPPSVAFANFTYGVLRSHNARFEVDSISDTATCPKSEAQGLVGVMTNSSQIGSNPGGVIEDAELGNTMHGAGSAPGFVLWDAPPPVGPICDSGDATVAYNALPFGVVNCPKPSLGFEATATSEFGDEVGLAGGVGKNLMSLKVLFASFACQSGHWNTGDCVSAPGATFTHPITANIYALNTANPPLPGVLLATVTQNQQIPYRPPADPVNCTGANLGQWFNLGAPGGGQCQNSISTVLMFTFPTGTTLPNQVIWTVAFNTTHYGANPIGQGAACFSSSGGCPYDSLNVGTMTFPGAPYAGIDVDPNGAFLNSVVSSSYCDGGAGGTGFLRLDTAPSGCWLGLTPLGEVTTN